MPSTPETGARRLIANTIEEIHPKILVIDDDPSIRQVLRDVLVFSGYAVDEVENAANAYDLIEKKAYDAILIDIVMPGENGLAVLEKLKAVEPNTPAIMLTGMPNVETAANALRLGAYDYLAKPIERSYLLNTVHRATEAKRLRDEKSRLETENLDYQRGLESLVEERTIRLRAQKEFLESILESLAHPFYVVDAETFTINIANSASDFEAITGRPTCYALTHGRSTPCRDPETPCVVEKVKETGRPYSAEHLHYDREGNAKFFEIHGYPIFDESGKPSQIILYSIDISEQKRLETIAAAKNLMENIGYVFSGIRHEIGNPINSLKTCLTVLQKQIDSLSIDQIKEFVQDALSETGRVEYLLRALKNFSLFERPEIQDVDLVDFMEGLRPIMAQDLEKGGISLQMDLPDGPCRGMLDPRALHHVMLNLLANAVDALKNEDHPQIDIRLAKLPGGITITFEDNGCGMTQREQADLFKPFYTSKFNGTGLGLVMVKRMLSEMNCSIRISSSKGNGTSVWINIPWGSH
jgi:C4-dicarboxylate-specific signal transduction histidine kinase